LLQAALNSASTTSPCPSWAAACSAVHPSCKDEGVSRQSGARMLHCCPYRESNTQIHEGGKNQGIRFTQPTIITRLLCVYITCVCSESSSCMQCKKTQAYARTSTHTHTHNTQTHTHDHSLALAFSLSLSLTHTHTYAQEHIQESQKYAKNMSSRQKTHQASYTSR
jgi:glutaredoxin